MQKIYLFLIISILLLSTSCKNHIDLPSIPIAVLIPLTGDGPIDGVAIKAAAEVAVDELNVTLDANFQLEFFDTEYSVETITSHLNTIIEREMPIVVSALTSSNLAVVADLINENELLLVDITSTSASLAQDDNIWRFIPDDNATSEAIRDLLVEQSFSKLAMVHRDDIWGNGLKDELTNLYANGGVIIGSESYDARLPLIDIPDKVSNLNDLISTTLQSFDASSIAVELFSFEEGIDLFVEASQYPALKSVKWFGSDGLANNKDLLENTEAAAFAAEVGCFCPVIGKQDTEEFTLVSDQIESKIQYEPYAVSLIMYDAVMATGNALVKKSSSNNDLESLFLASILEYNFVTGPMIINSNGDRVSCNYDFWGVRNNGSTYEWYKAY